MKSAKSSENLPMPVDELETLATYYDTHDTSSDMQDGKWVDPRPMMTTSLRLPADVVDALKTLAKARGVRYTTFVREVIERALSNASPTENEELARINERLARIEAAVTQKSA